jgi:ankyrin repeat protein
LVEGLAEGKAPDASWRSVAQSLEAKGATGSCAARAAGLPMLLEKEFDAALNDGSPSTEARARAALLRSGCDWSKVANPVTRACGLGDMPLVKELLAVGASPDEIGCDVGDSAPCPGAPLRAAARVDCGELVTILIGAGADPNSVNGTGQTPAIVAAHNGSSKAARALIAGGADLLKVDNEGRTALHVSVDNWQRQDVIRILAKACPEAREVADKHGVTPHGTGKALRDRWGQFACRPETVKALAPDANCLIA